MAKRTRTVVPCYRSLAPKPRIALPLLLSVSVVRQPLSCVSLLPPTDRPTDSLSSLSRFGPPKTAFFSNPIPEGRTDTLPLLLRVVAEISYPIEFLTVTSIDLFSKT